MRVLHVSSDCGHGGVETMLAALIREQRKSGIEADAYFLVDQGGVGHYENLCKVMFAKTHSLMQVLLTGGYDLIHATSYVSEWVRRASARSFYPGSIVVSCHSFGAYTPGLRSDAVTAVSAAIAESIRDRCPHPVTVVYNGVDTERFYPPQSSKASGKPIMAWVGRSGDGVKDYAGLTAVALSNAAREFQVMVVDGSPEGNECGDWLPEGSMIVRRKPWREMPDFYRAIRESGGFLLSTSRMEACPMNVLEAQACGCPVIAPSVGGIPEIVAHQSTGYLYEPDCGVEAVERGLHWLYRGTDYETVSRAAADHVAGKHTIRKTQEDFATVYEEATNRHRCSRGKRLGHRVARLATPAIAQLLKLRRR